MNENLDLALQLRRDGMSVTGIASRLHVHPRTVRKWLASVANESASLVQNVPVDLPHIPASKAGITEAMVVMLRDALARLQASNPAPDKVASVLPKFARVVMLLPDLELSENAPVSLDAFRNELAAKLEALKANYSEEG